MTKTWKPNLIHIWESESQINLSSDCRRKPDHLKENLTNAGGVGGGGACKGHTEIPFFFLLLFHLFCILVATKKLVANEGITWYLLRSFPDTVTAPIWYHTNIYCPLQNHIRCSSYASFQRSPKHNTVRNNPCPLGCRDCCRFSEKCLATV